MQLEIIKKGKEKPDSVAFRVFGKDNQVDFYSSSRLGQIKVTSTGFIIAVPDEHIGKEFELKDVSGKKVIASGKLEKGTKKDDTQN